VRGVGCIDYRSVVETQIGIFFQSNAGIYVVPRGFGTPQYLGANVQDTLTEYPTILSSAMVRSDEFSTVRFLLADTNGSGDEGSRAVVYDIDNGHWFVDTFDVDDLLGLSEIGNGPAGALMFRYDLSGLVDPVWVEDESVFTDAGGASTTFVARTVTTTWLYPFGPGGWGRVNKDVLSMSHDYPGGTDTDAALVSLTVEVDAPDPSVDTTDSWTVTGSATSDVDYRGFDLVRRDCTAIRATIADVVNAGVPEARGPKFLSLTFEIENGGGIRMLTDSER
jgi:hypothetical protein